MKKQYKKYYKISIPCSIFLAGEHAVLNKKKSIITSIEKRIIMEAIENKSKYIKIKSDKFGTKKIKINDKINMDNNLNYILECINLFKNELKYGFDIKIRSNNCSKIGLGSSGAIVAGTITLIYKMIKKNINLVEIYKISKKVIKKIQNKSSFGDIFASIFGGIYLYDTINKKYKRLYLKKQLGLIFCGYKKNTKDVLKYMEKKYTNHKDLLNNYFLIYDILIRNIVSYIEENSILNLGKSLYLSNLLLHSIGLSDNNLNKIYNLIINKTPGMKISGSGLGDCMVYIKNFEKNKKNYKLKYINLKSKKFITKTTDLGLTFH